LNVGSLFSGIGGIELGFEREGFKTSWFVEKDSFCRKVLRKNFPGKKIYGDITKLDFSKLEKVSVLTGGFPCQDISVAGKKAGIKGERSGLWRYFVEAIRVLRPSFAVIENVSALSFRGLDVVLGDLAKIGYDAEWFCLRACWFGAPHRRERIFIIAYPSDRRIQESSEKLESYAKTFFARKFSFSSVKLGSGNGLRVKDWEESRTIESAILGVDDGIPKKLDRVKSLGNAVIPQVAQFVARRIKEIKKKGVRA